MPFYIFDFQGFDDEAKEDIFVFLIKVGEPSFLKRFISKQTFSENFLSQLGNQGNLPSLFRKIYSPNAFLLSDFQIPPVISLVEQGKFESVFFRGFNRNFLLEIYPEILAHPTLRGEDLEWIFQNQFINDPLWWAFAKNPNMTEKMAGIFLDQLNEKMDRNLLHALMENPRTPARFWDQFWRKFNENDLKLILKNPALPDYVLQRLIPKKNLHPLIIDHPNLNIEILDGIKAMYSPDAPIQKIIFEKRHEIMGRLSQGV